MCRRCSVQKPWKSTFSITPLSFDASSPENPCEYPHKLYVAKNYTQWPTFLPLIVWVYLHSFFCGGLRKTHLFWNRMRIGRSRSSKVVDFGTNRKGVCDLLLVINSNFDPILHRFWDTASYWLKIANFSYPTLVWRPRSGGSRQNFRMKLTALKLEGWGYCTVKIAWS